jgi:tetratricopeptide (TPR) repeat protein
MGNDFSGKADGQVVQARRIDRLEIHSAPSSPTALDGLPRRSATFTGRHSELAELGRTTGLTVVSGLAGVGKTELLLHYAHQAREAFPGKFLFHDLHGYDSQLRVEPTEVLSSFLGRLGVRGADIPPEESGRAALFRSLMADRPRMLVLLDNASSTAQISSLLPGTPQHRVIISSRHTLSSLDDANQLELGVLGHAEAVRLIGDDELAELCGRLPLALQIMAALIRTDPEADWAAELRDARLDVLDDGDSRAVHAAFKLSYESLDSEQRRLFRLLALHPGDEIGVDSAAALVDLSPTAAARMLRGLRSAHLLEGRYRFHDLVRLYAIRRLDEETERDREAAQDRVLRFYTETATGAGKHLLQRHRSEGNDRAKALAWLDANYRQVIAAASLGRDEDVITIAKATHDFFNLRKHMTDWLRLQLLALGVAQRQGDPTALAATLNRLGTIYRQLRRFDEAIACSEESLKIGQQLDDQHVINTALTTLGSSYRNTGRFGEARDCFERALEINRLQNDDYGLGITLTNLGATCRDIGELDQAIAYHQESLRIRERQGDDRGKSITLLTLGGAYSERGQHDLAIASYEESLRIRRERGDRYGEGLTLADLGTVHQQIGQHQEAEQAYLAALAAFEESRAEHEARRVRDLLAENGGHEPRDRR